MGHTLSTKLLPTYLATRKGNCVSMPFLFIVLGQKLGVDLTGATAPSHYFVKYRDENGAIVDLEATSGAGVTSDGWIRREMPITEEAVASGIYLQRLTKKETLASMLDTLMEHYRETGRYEEQIALAKLALNYYPKDVMAILQIHSAFGRMIQQEFQTRYAGPRDVPEVEKPRFRELNWNAQLWRQKAEALGWREPTDEDEEQYQQNVDVARSTQ